MFPCPCVCVCVTEALTCTCHISSPCLVCLFCNCLSAASPHIFPNPLHTPRTHTHFSSHTLTHVHSTLPIGCYANSLLLSWEWWDEQKCSGEFEIILPPTAGSSCPWLLSCFKDIFINSESWIIRNIFLSLIVSGDLLELASVWSNESFITFHEFVFLFCVISFVIHSFSPLPLNRLFFITTLLLFSYIFSQTCCAFPKKYKPVLFNVYSHKCLLPSCTLYISAFLPKYLYLELISFTYNTLQYWKVSVLHKCLFLPSNTPDSAHEQLESGTPILEDTTFIMNNTSGTMNYTALSAGSLGHRCLSFSPLSPCFLFYSIVWRSTLKHLTLLFFIFPFLFHFTSSLSHQISLSSMSLKINYTNQLTNHLTTSQPIIQSTILCSTQLCT